MRFNAAFIRTLREIAETDSTWTSYRLVLRAGLIIPAETGVYHWTPLGVRVLRQLERYLAGDDAPLATRLHVSTSQEWLDVATLAGQVINSYKQLPQRVYQVRHQTYNGVARGGLIRLRQYQVFSAYGLGQTESLADHYAERLAQLRLAVVQAEGVAGSVGFYIPHSQGDDELMLCEECGTLTSREATNVLLPSAPMLAADLPLTKVHTPDCKTIQAVADFVGVPTTQTLKAVFLTHEHPTQAPRLVFAVVRGDVEVSEAKILAHLGLLGELRPATEAEIRAVGAVPGYASPIGLNPAQVTLILDAGIETNAAYVVGANEAEYHYTGAVPVRDFPPMQRVDIALADEGMTCAKCQSGQLSIETAVEVGYVATLPALGAEYLDANGKRQALPIQVARFGLERLLAMLLEVQNDENGIVWEEAIAPFDIHLIVLGKKEETLQQAEALYRQLLAHGKAVLFDDRKESPGVKFADADLLGIPTRITISDRSLENGGAEVMSRREREAQIISLDELV